MKFIHQTVLSLFLLGFFSNQSYTQESFKVQSLILNESNLRINGTSNVNDFECVFNGDFEESSLTHKVYLGKDNLSVSGDSLALQIDSFDCGKRAINRDFRNTLKSSEFPNIVIHLSSIKRNSTTDSALVSINLAGVSKEYALPLSNVKTENGNVVYNGFQSLKMTDFNIDPPTALLGLVKVRDELMIHFELVMKSESDL